MHLVPTADNAGPPFWRALFTALRRDLTERFGGVTVCARSPAQGFRDSEEGRTCGDSVIFEHMADALDEGGWRATRHLLERMDQEHWLAAYRSPLLHVEP